MNTGSDMTPQGTVSDNQIILALSGKGGTGKTTVSAGVTSCLAALGHGVVLLDADVGMRNADIVLGVTDKAVMDFGDVIDGACSLDDALIAHPVIKDLAVLPAPAGFRNTDPAAFLTMMAGLRERFRYIWIDGPAGISEWVRLLSRMSHKVLLVATPDVSSIRDAARVAGMLDDPGTRGSLIVNRIRPRLIRKGGAMLVDDIMDETGLPLLGLVPEDERVILAGNKGQPLVALGQDGAALAYRNIALRLLGERIPLSDIKAVSNTGGNFFRRLNRYNTSGRNAQ